MEKQTKYRSQWDGPIKIVPPDQVEPFTRQGWVVLDNVEHDEVETSFSNVPNPSPRPTDCGHPDYYSYQEMLSTTQQIPVRRRQFVLGLPKETLLQELNDKLAALELKLTESQTKVAAHDKIVQDLENTASRVRENSGHYKKLYEDATVNATALRQKLRLMEDDMAKVRGEIGEGQWRKIVKVSDE